MQHQCTETTIRSQRIDVAMSLKSGTKGLSVGHCAACSGCSRTFHTLLGADTGKWEVSVFERQGKLEHKKLLAFFVSVLDDITDFITENKLIGAFFWSDDYKSNMKWGGVENVHATLHFTRPGGISKITVALSANPTPGEFFDSDILVTLGLAHKSDVVLTLGRGVNSSPVVDVDGASLWKTETTTLATDMGQFADALCHTLAGVVADLHANSTTLD